MRARVLAATVAVLLVAAGGCSSSDPSDGSDGSDGSSPTTSESPTSESPTTTAAPPVPSGSYEDVEFAALDGEVRSGRLFGDDSAGPVGVVLSHMGRSGDGQDDWAAFALELAERGHRVLTYDRRSDMDDGWQDVLGAAAYLRDAGAERVVAGGASLGAMASLHAATQPEASLDGVIWLAGVLDGEYTFAQADVAALACPMVLLSGDRDGYGAADDTRQLHEWVTAPNELVIVDSDRHGTDVLLDGGPAADELAQAMLAFVDRVAAEPVPC